LKAASAAVTSRADVNNWKKKSQRSISKKDGR
jgi:hypothetical protein